MIYKGFAFFLALCLVSCSTHRTASIGWEGDKVSIRMTPPGGSSLFTSPVLECLTCNEPIPAVATSFDDNGEVKFKLGEANERITHRFRLDAAGIDTALILKPPTPDEAMKRYRLTQKLVGRVLITEFTLIYRDSTMKDVVSQLERQDEANIFSESDVFYYIHHPRYKEPVVILKTSAVRLY